MTESYYKPIRFNNFKTGNLIIKPKPMYSLTQCKRNTIATDIPSSSKLSKYINHTVDTRAPLKASNSNANAQPSIRQSISKDHTYHEQKHIKETSNEEIKDEISHQKERAKGYSRIEEPTFSKTVYRNSQNSLSCTQTVETMYKQKQFNFSPPFTQFVDWENKCNCDRDPATPFCKKAQRWFETAKKYKNNFNFDSFTLKSRYYSIVNASIDVNKDFKEQIQRDIVRSFPKHPYFSGNSIGLLVLERILITYTKYAAHIGYVQGMNFIVGSLLYHCKEEAAFWLFVMLMEDYELEDVYIKGVPGLYKHSAMMDKLLSKQKCMSDIYAKLRTNDIKIEMFATDWIFTLFSNLLPIEVMADFYDHFFSESWPFLYGFLFAILLSCKKEIMDAEDGGDIISPLRCKNGEEERKGRSLMSRIKQMLFEEVSFWLKCIKMSYTFHLDRAQILNDLSRFDKMDNM